MTRPEFEAYEKRVEAVLSNAEQSIDRPDRAGFAEIAAAARDVVSIRREYLERSEQQAGPSQDMATAVSLRTALINAERTTNIRGMEGERVPDPVAQAILASGHVSQIEAALVDAGVTEALIPIGGGASSVVLRSRDRVVRLGHWEAGSRPDISEVLQSVAYGNVGGIGYEILPLADTAGLSARDVEQMTSALGARGYEFTDPGTDNLGRLGDQLVVIDAGAVAKRLHHGVLEAGNAKSGGDHRSERNHTNIQMHDRDEREW